MRATLCLSVVAVACFGCGGGGGGGGGTRNCPTGALDCDGTCVSAASDALNCGTCGHACPSDTFCSAGECVDRCGTGEVLCGNSCINPASDPGHCGIASNCTGGSTCGAGTFCSGGSCVSRCGTELAWCGNTCVDPQTDPNHCGVTSACSGGNICDTAAGQYCSGGTCVSRCGAGQSWCDSTCVDPQSDPNHCGSAADCSGGVVCGAGSFCYQGTCYAPCAPGYVFCGGSCVDPSLDANHCGASGTCRGDEAGASCGATQLCRAGQCTAFSPDLDWSASQVSPTTPPRFPEGPSTLAHIVFDGTNMVDLTGNTHWTKVGSPGAVSTGMWTPAQSYSGPFSASDHWEGDAATKAFLDANTSGDFLVCARFKPGAHPMTNPTKIIIANGNPEGLLGSGWSLMQMHNAYCFHYHDTVVNPGGEWMASSVFPTALGTVDALLPAEWSYICGGRDGTTLTMTKEGTPGGFGLHGMSGQTGHAVGTFLPSTDLPTIGSYFDGSSPLSDGGVYEIIITSDPATPGNATNVVARAAGGVNPDWSTLAQVMGADGYLHYGSPSTVTVDAAGWMTGSTRLIWGRPVERDAAIYGACYGLDLAADDWAALPSQLRALYLVWNRNLSYHLTEMRWNNTAAYCANTQNEVDGFYYTCGAPPGLSAGSRHQFLECFDPADQRMRLYADGSSTAFAVSDPLSLSVFPPLGDPETLFSLSTISSTARVYRVFACPGPNPGLCW